MKLLRHESILGVLTLLFILAAALISIFTGNTSTPLETPEVTVSPYLININTADKEELDLLDGIGPALAERIIEYRNTNGSFESADELSEVSGIGPDTVNNIRKYIEV